MQPHILLTHVTTHNSESTDSSIMNLLHINSPICDFEYPTQSFSSSTLVDMICNNLSPLVLVIGSSL